jgi:hypothetical protein
MSLYRLIEQGMEPHTQTYHYSLLVADRCLMANRPYRECFDRLLGTVSQGDRYEEIDFDGRTRCSVSGQSIIDNHRLQQARFRENVPL